MASLTIRRLDDDLKTKLRVRAAHHGRSMEEEARQILKSGVSAEPAVIPNLAEAIRRRIQPFDGVELTLPPRKPVRRPPDFSR